MMAPSKKLLAALAAVFLLNILVIGGVQSLTTPALAAVYQQGSQGETVRQIQTKLKRWGYYDGEVDGIYGSATTEAVKYFQRRNGLTADGIAGNATLQAMGISTGASSSGSESGRDNDLYLMARMISAEARGEPYEGQVAVASFFSQHGLRRDLPARCLFRPAGRPVRRAHCRKRLPRRPGRHERLGPHRRGHLLL